MDLKLTGEEIASLIDFSLKTKGGAPLLLAEEMEVTDVKADGGIFLIQVNALGEESDGPSETKPRNGAPDIEKECVVCGTEFIAHHPKAMYCSDPCRAKRAWERKRARDHQEAGGQPPDPQ